MVQAEMSLRYEQHRALRLSRDLLTGIANGTVKRIQKAVRTQARLALRHFPFLTDENEPIFSRDNMRGPTSHFVHLPAIDARRNGLTVCPTEAE
jgi:hypothetical protein